MDTFSYEAQDAAGNVIKREGLTLKKLAIQVGNLACAGYVMDITEEATGRKVPTAEVPPSWSL